MSHVLYRHNVGNQPPVAVAGDGPYLIDAAGKRYIDASAGAAVSCLGHSNEAVRKAIRDQVDHLAYAHTRFFTTEPAERLADDLVADAPAHLNKVWLTCGGSEAIEAALKITRQYFVEIGQPQRKFMIARRQGYHGNTFGALSVSGNIWRRRQFESMLLNVTHHISAAQSAPLQGGGRNPPKRTRAALANELRSQKSSSSGPTAWPHSSPKPWSARRSAPSPRRRVISSASARSATSTASC